MKKILLFLILLLSFSPTLAFGAEAIQQEAQKLETEDVDRAARGLDAETDFSKLLSEVLSGEFDLTFEGIQEKVAEMVFGEFRLQGKLLMQLVRV